MTEVPTNTDIPSSTTPGDLTPYFIYHKLPLKAGDIASAFAGRGIEAALGPEALAKALEVLSVKSAVGELILQPDKAAGMLAMQIQATITAGDRKLIAAQGKELESMLFRALLVGSTGSVGTDLPIKLDTENEDYYSLAMSIKGMLIQAGKIPAPVVN